MTLIDARYVVSDTFELAVFRRTIMRTRVRTMMRDNATGGDFRVARLNDTPISIWRRRFGNDVSTRFAAVRRIFRTSLSVVRAVCLFVPSCSSFSPISPFVRSFFSFLPFLPLARSSFAGLRQNDAASLRMTNVPRLCGKSF